jgi:hypothetical protein
MWTFEVSRESSASPEQVFRRWSEVARWTDWDDGLTASSLDGPFSPGTTGKLKPKGGPSVRFTLLAVEHNVGFEDVTSLPLATLTFRHRAVPSGSGSRITHRVEIAGPLGFLFARIMGPDFAKGLPETVEKLARLAAQPMR